MANVVRCECGKSWKLPVEAAGKSVRCPACQARIVIPSPETAAVPAAKETSASAAACPACGSALRPDAVLCVMCGFNLRTGRKAGEAAPASESKARGRYPQTGLSLVYWGTRFGFSLITASLGLGLVLVGFALTDRPGAETSDMALMMVLGFTISAFGVQVGAKGSRLDWFGDDEDELEFDELVLARGAPTLAGLVVTCVWATGRIDILFNLLLPLGLVACTTAIVIGLTLCIVMSASGVQKLLALGSALGYVGGAVLLLTATVFQLSLGLAVLSAALGEVCFLMWLRALGRQLDFEAAVAHVMRLLLFVAIGSAGVSLLGMLLSSSIQAALSFPPVFSSGAFAYYLIAVLYVTTATIWRLKIMRALMDEIEVLQANSAG
jgi:hypothetical protein